MGLRRGIGGLALAAVCALTACNDKGDAKDTKKGPPDLGASCEKAARACGDSDKHIEKLVAECKDVAQQKVKATCADEAAAIFDCYQKELCGKDDKIWSLDDFRVLAERHGKCIAERDALRTCVGE